MSAVAATISSVQTPPQSRHRYIGLRISCWCVALTLGALQAWATRFTMNPDGVSYLDIGDAYWRGDWHNAINAYWSPLYSWILGFFLKVFKPSIYWEYPLVHLVNFLIYVAALGCFEYFLSELIRREKQPDVFLRNSEDGLPEWAWWTLGYSVFAFTSLVMIDVATVAPDMGVAALFYAASALLLRIARDGTSMPRFAAFGVVLGIGYVAKTIFLPLGFVFLAVAFLSVRTKRKVLAQLLLSALIFLAISSPFITAISRSKGRMTIGESGKWNYLVFVDGNRPLFPENPSLKHVARRIADSPATYDFSDSIGGTYPPWYDPSYWQEGDKPHIDLKAQTQIVKISLLIYAAILCSPTLQLNMAIGMLLLFFLTPRPSTCFRRIAAYWFLLAPICAGLAAYASLVVVQRYVAPLVCVLWLVALTGPRSSAPGKNVMGGIAALMTVTTLLLIARVTGVNASTRPPGDEYGKATKALRDAGLRPGDKLAILWQEDWQSGRATGVSAVKGGFVPRLAKLRVVGEITDPAAFWNADPLSRRAILTSLSRTGAQAVLTYGVPPAYATNEGWFRLGATEFYAHTIEPASPQGPLSVQ